MAYIADNKSGLSLVINLIDKARLAVEKAEIEAEKAREEKNQTKRITHYLNIEYHISQYNLYMQIMEDINIEDFTKAYEMLQQRSHNVLLEINNLYKLGGWKNEKG